MPQKNDKKLAEFANEMEDSNFSFRDLENLVTSSKKYYLEDLLKDKYKDFDIKYLKKAMKTKTLTDCEIMESR